MTVDLAAGSNRVKLTSVGNNGANILNGDDGIDDQTGEVEGTDGDASTVDNDDTGIPNAVGTPGLDDSGDEGHRSLRVVHGVADQACRADDTIPKRGGVDAVPQEHVHTGITVEQCPHRRQVVGLQAAHARGRSKHASGYAGRESSDGGNQRQDTVTCGSAPSTGGIDSAKRMASSMRVSMSSSSGTLRTSLPCLKRMPLPSPHRGRRRP